MSKLNSEFNYRYQTIGETIWGLPRVTALKYSAKQNLSPEVIIECRSKALFFEAKR